MVERIRNVRNKKALIQLNLNLTLPKLSRSHFSFVQKHFGIILTDTFWVVCVSVCCCRWLTPSRRLGPHTGHLSFSCMRGGGILQRCHEATELKPLSLIQFSIFGLNVRLDNEKFCASFLKALVKDFGLKFPISNGKSPFAATMFSYVVWKWKVHTLRNKQAPLYNPSSTRAISVQMPLSPVWRGSVILSRSNSVKCHRLA